uniref:Uncharacterized protein n=1 Tax=Ditylenchus dipsaci TaxID=166011 RepID=A0A915CRZ9_9BILA
MLRQLRWLCDPLWHLGHRQLDLFNLRWGLHSRGHRSVCLDWNLFASVKQVPQLYLPALVVNLVYIVLHESWFFCFLVSALFMVFVEVVVYRAYMKMKEENSRHHIPIAELNSGSKKPLISLNSNSPQVTGATIYG